MKIFNWLATLWGGSVRLATPMLFCLGFIAMFTIGGLSGVTHSLVARRHASRPTRTSWSPTSTTCCSAASCSGLFGGIYYWYPKIFGKMLNERWASGNFWLMLIGFNLTFFPMHFLGLEGDAAPHLHLRRRAWAGTLEPHGDRRRVHHRDAVCWCSSST